MKTLPQIEKEFKEKNKIIINIMNLILDKFDYKKYKNKEIILLNGDSDFPPIKKEFLNDKGLNLNYQERINYNIIDKIKEYNIKIKCFNPTVINKNIENIFLGPTWQIKIPDFVFNKEVKKDILCYANFGLPTVDCYHGRIRRKLIENLKKLDFVTIENCSLDTTKRKTKQDYNNYFQMLKRSKYSICPRGCGIECYRIYDSILCGCIPIVVNYGDFKEYMKDLPIIFLENWNDLKIELLK